MIVGQPPRSRGPRGRGVACGDGRGRPDTGAGPATAARLGLALIAAAGARDRWSDAARDALAPLRRHPDLRVRHAALQVFTRREAPAAGIDDEDPDSYFDD